MTTIYAIAILLVAVYAIALLFALGLGKSSQEADMEMLEAYYRFLEEEGRDS